MGLEVRLVCDRCGKKSDFVSGHNITIARRHAASEGWAVRVRAGYDYCSDCRTSKDHSQNWRKSGY